VGTASSLPRMEHLKGASLRQAPALTTNIRLGWKDLLGTNTLAFYKHSYIISVQNFITLGPGFNVSKTCFFAINAPVK
jgi:hypothetical protein